MSPHLAANPAPHYPQDVDMCLLDDLLNAPNFPTPSPFNNGPGGSSTKASFSEIPPSSNNRDPSAGGTAHSFAPRGSSTASDYGAGPSTTPHAFNNDFSAPPLYHNSSEVPTDRSSHDALNQQILTLNRELQKMHKEMRSLRIELKRKIELNACNVNWMNGMGRNNQELKDELNARQQGHATQIASLEEVHRHDIDALRREFHLSNAKTLKTQRTLDKVKAALGEKITLCGIAQDAAHRSQARLDELKTLTRQELLEVGQMHGPVGFEFFDALARVRRRAAKRKSTPSSFTTDTPNTFPHPKTAVPPPYFGPTGAASAASSTASAHPPTTRSPIASPTPIRTPPPPSCAGPTAPLSASSFSGPAPSTNVNSPGTGLLHPKTAVPLPSSGSTGAASAASSTASAHPPTMPSPITNPTPIRTAPLPSCASPTAPPSASSSSGPASSANVNMPNTDTSHPKTATASSGPAPPISSHTNSTPASSQPAPTVPHASSSSTANSAAHADSSGSSYPSRPSTGTHAQRPNTSDEQHPVQGTSVHGQLDHARRSTSSIPSRREGNSDDSSDGRKSCPKRPLDDSDDSSNDDSSDSDSGNNNSSAKPIPRKHRHKRKRASSAGHDSDQSVVQRRVKANALERFNKVMSQHGLHDLSKAEYSNVTGRIRESFYNLMEWRVSSDVVTHPPADETTVQSFEGGRGPGPTQVQFALCTEATGAWNLAVLKILADQIGAKQREKMKNRERRVVWCFDDGRRMPIFPTEIILYLLKAIWTRVRRSWPAVQARPLAGDNRDENHEEIQARLNNKFEHDNTVARRKNRVQSKHRWRTQVCQDQLRNTDPNDFQRIAVWTFLLQTMTFLGTQGTSSDESDEETAATNTLQVHKMPWRRPMDLQLAEIDRLRKVENVGRDSRGMKPMIRRRDGPGPALKSTRRVPRKLPEALYDPQWLSSRNEMYIDNLKPSNPRDYVWKEIMFYPPV